MKLALILLGTLALLFLCRRLLGRLGRFLFRSGLGLGALWLLQAVGQPLGIGLGVNLFNAAVLGALGMPGFALLMLTQWVLR